MEGDFSTGFYAAGSINEHCPDLRAYVGWTGLAWGVVTDGLEDTL